MVRTRQGQDIGRQLGVCCTYSIAPPGLSWLTRASCGSRSSSEAPEPSRGRYNYGSSFGIASVFFCYVWIITVHERDAEKKSRRRRALELLGLVERVGDVPVTRSLSGPGTTSQALARPSNPDDRLTAMRVATYASICCAPGRLPYGGLHQPATRRSDVLEPVALLLGEARTPPRSIVPWLLLKAQPLPVLPPTLPPSSSASIQPHLLRRTFLPTPPEAPGRSGEAGRIRSKPPPNAPKQSDGLQASLSLRPARPAVQDWLLHLVRVDGVTLALGPRRVGEPISRLYRRSRLPFFPSVRRSVPSISTLLLSVIKPRKDSMEYFTLQLAAGLAALLLLVVYRLHRQRSAWPSPPRVPGLGSVPFMRPTRFLEQCLEWRDRYG